LPQPAPWSPLRLPFPYWGADSGHPGAGTSPGRCRRRHHAEEARTEKTVATTSRWKSSGRRCRSPRSAPVEPHGLARGRAPPVRPAHAAKSAERKGAPPPPSLQAARHLPAAHSGGGATKRERRSRRRLGFDRRPSRPRGERLGELLRGLRSTRGV